MKVYFTCSARGSKDLQSKYLQIYEIIDGLGHQHLDDYRNANDPKKVYEGSHEENLQLYERAMDFIKKADVVVLEVSTHSLSMGYLLQQGLSLGKPVIALYELNHTPAFVAGIENDKLQLIEYSDENIESELSAAIKNSQDMSDVRFNFFISPEIARYFEWISKVKKIPRSVYLRALIEEDIEKNKEFQNFDR